MPLLQNLSIRRKQTLIIMLTSSLVLLLACTAVVVYVTRNFRINLIANTRVLTDVIAKQSTAAINFNDALAAAETLAALRAEAHVIAACVYDRQGRVFVRYERPHAGPAFAFPPVGGEGQEFTNDRLQVFQRVQDNGEIIGTIFIAVDLQQLSRGLTRLAGLISVVFFLALLLALGLANWLQRFISDPILHLAQVSRTVARGQDYSVRATKQNDDEVGRLIDEFNAMLAQIQTRDTILQQQQTELRVLFDYLPAMIVFKDTQNVIVRANHRLAEIVGKSIGEIEGKPTAEIFPQEAAQYFADDLEVIRSGTPKLGIIETVRDQAGKALTIQTDKVPVCDPAGKVVGLITMAQDITARQLAEQALLESRRFLRSTLDALSSHIAILDEHGAIIEVNAAWNRFAINNNFIGGDRGAGDNYLKVCDTVFGKFSEEASAVATGLRAIMAGQRDEFHLEYPCHSPTEKRWFVVRVTRFAGDGPVRVVVAHENITERKQAESSLVESQQRLALAKESAHIGIWDWDVVANKLDWDARMFELYGIRAPEFSGAYDAWQKGLHPDERARGDAAIHAALAGDKDFHIEFRVVWPGGEVRHLEGSATVIRADDGTPTRMIGVNWDITERKKLEALLFQSQKMETVGKLAGGVAHEFNSILTAIIGQSELLLDDLPAGGSLAESATEITKAANRAATLTRQLLAYGRKQFLQLEVLNLNSVLAATESTLRHLLGRGVDVRLALAADVKPVKADAGQIEQVLMNLAMNAADAMPNGGKLTLETANVTLDEAYTSHFPELIPGDYVMLAVTDTGRGMTEAVKARLFEPFFTTKDVGEGTGLGLSTCYGIVKQSGGHISVYSEPGRGTTFKIYLPQVEPLTPPAVARLETPDLPRGTETILLVEDDPALREMAATLLRRLGYTVLAAANGIEALSLKQQPGTGHIDLLFTDVVMPHMSGKELADRVRALYPHTKILFTSAYTENAIVHQGALAQGVTLLQKPFTPSALAHKLRAVLDQPPAG